MANSFNERRKHFRICRNFIMSYHEKGETNVQDDISQVNNVSKGGMNFISKVPLKLGLVITIDLKTLFIKGSIPLEGTVLDCKERIPGMIYFNRLQFQDVPEQVLTLLEKIDTSVKAKED